MYLHIAIIALNNSVLASISKLSKLVALTPPASSSVDNCRQACDAFRGHCMLAGFVIGIGCTKGVKLIKILLIFEQLCKIIQGIHELVSHAMC